MKEMSLWQIFFIFFLALLIKSDEIDASALTVLLVATFFANCIVFFCNYTVQYLLKVTIHTTRPPTRINSETAERETEMDYRKTTTTTTTTTRTTELQESARGDDDEEMDMRTDRFPPSFSRGSGYSNGYNNNNNNNGTSTSNRDSDKLSSVAGDCAVVTISPLYANKTEATSTI
jgi:hypothetical protein